jgi:hypothetical protein
VTLRTQPDGATPDDCSQAALGLAEHAAAGELTVEYPETGREALPAIWDGRAQTKIIVKPKAATPS